MKKQILPLLMMLPALCAWGFDAYFYNGNTNKPALVAKQGNRIKIEKYFETRSA